MELNRRQFIVTSALVAAGGLGCRKRRHLTLEFRGLCAIVFSDTPPAMDVLLVDGEKTSNPGIPHLARLLAAPDIWVSGESLEPTGKDEGSEKQFWDLKNHRVTLAVEGLPPLTKVTGQRDPKTNAPGDDVQSQADISWLASMSKIPGGGEGRINPQCLAPDPRPAKIASGLRFTSGEASAHFKEPKYGNVIWRISSPGAPPLEQALAELRLIVAIPSEKVIFNLEPFNGDPPKRIVLKPKSDVIAVGISNAPDPKHVECKEPKHARELTHFSAFYQLLAPPLATGPVPICVEPCTLTCPPPPPPNQREGSGQAEIVFCPPAVYRP
jgi:hypothetical protein